MCEVGATCPNCGQPDLDQDETFCATTFGVSTRSYLCRQCGARITVMAPPHRTNR